MRKPIIATAVAAIALSGASTAAAAAPQATNLEKVSSVVQPGIVYLETTYKGFVRDQQGRWLNGGMSLDATASCSGFFVNPDGHFVTAGHCVDKSEGRAILIKKAWARTATPASLDTALKTWTVRSAETQAKLGPDRSVAAAYGVNYGGFRSGKPLPARVDGFRPFLKGDVALLKVEAENVPTLELAPSGSVDIGTEIVSVGYPATVNYATDPTFDPSFKEGSVSSERTIKSGLVSVAEISAALSPGMSGGPTVDLQGRVMGVNSFMPYGEKQPFNFVSPVAEVAQLLADEGVKNELGEITDTYRDGLAAYYKGDRGTALAKFDDVLGQVPEYRFAQQFRAKALRLPKPAVHHAAPKSSGLPATVIAGIALIVLAMAAAAAILIRRRRGGSGPAKATAPQAPHTPLLPGNGNGNGNRAGTALQVTAGPLAGSRIAVDSELTMGRGDVDVDLADPEVSRHHARIQATQVGMVLTDLDSANGTEVNGARIDRPTLLMHGDQIVLGETAMRVELVQVDWRRAATVMRPSQRS